jgi:RNA polymerase II subunit A C-terminal domain phosphatase SSU72
MNEKRRLRFAMICISNMNRSIGVHEKLLNAGFQVKSFGVGNKIKLPGLSKEKPILFPFGTTYEEIGNSLQKLDNELYTTRGLLKLCKRNKLIKKAPQRWQSEPKINYDIVVTFEKYAFDKVIDKMEITCEFFAKPLLVLNVEVEDRIQDVETAKHQIQSLCEKFQNILEKLDENIKYVLETFKNETSRRVLYTICFY